MTMRFKLPGCGDVPPAVAARRIALTLPVFNERLPQLLARGFPPADPTTGNYDLDAIDRWRKSRYPHLFPETLTVAPTARDASDVVRTRLAGMHGGRREN
jgi:hypothetical protein